MRTTVTLEPDVAASLEEFAQRSRMSFKASLNTVLRRGLAGLGVGGNLTTGAHLAAIAIEHQCEIHGNDTGFGRFPGLRWRDPLPGTR